jgi:hypothetical protein
VNFCIYFCGPKKHPQIIQQKPARQNRAAFLLIEPINQKEVSFSG